MTPTNIYAILGPAVLLCVVVEFIYCLYKKNGYYSFQDSLMGLGTMIIAQCVNLAIAIGILVGYGYIYENYALTHVALTPLNLALCYIGVDFLFYWFHRAGHRVNILWAAHATHHSTEELNYAVALRTSFTQRAASFLFYWPLAVVGFEPALIVSVVALNLVIQFLPHTRVIPRFPKWIDAWLNTPYHHRIHHAANEMYWDKNYSGSFIIWDKLFGTYQDEVEPIFYGITQHPRSWDPTWLNLHWFAVLWRDMRAATHFSDKIKIWFKPPGWRPRNLPPFEKSKKRTAANQAKYVTEALPNSTPYLIFQLVLQMALLFFVISDQSPLEALEKTVISVLLWAAVTLWSAILESKSWARVTETIRIVAGTAIVGGFFTKYEISTLYWGLLLGSSAISLVTLWFWVKGPTPSAKKKNEEAKVAPDYKEGSTGFAYSGAIKTSSQAHPTAL